MDDKIKLVRFMSEAEFKRYLRGDKLENHTDWKRDRAKKTNSVGFCFFPYDEEPEKMIEVLTGIATLEKVVIVETDTRNICKTSGEYRDPSKDRRSLYELLTDPLGNINARTREEYCTERYNIEDFRPLRVGDVLDPFQREIDWYWEKGYPVRLW